MNQNMTSFRNFRASQNSLPLNNAAINANNFSCYMTLLTLLICSICVNNGENAIYMLHKYFIIMSFSHIVTLPIFFIIEIK